MTKHALKFILANLVIYLKEKTIDAKKKYSESVRQKYFYPGKNRIRWLLLDPFDKQLARKLKPINRPRWAPYTDEMRRTEQERRKKKKKAHNSNRF